MFFTTFAHAAAGVIKSVAIFAKKELPAVKSIMPVLIGVAEVADPKDAKMFEAMGNAASALLGHAISVMTDAQAVDQAVKTGTLTLSIGTEAILDIQAMVPATIDLVHAVGLGHTVPATVALPKL